VHAIVIDGDVDVDNVAALERPRVGNPVADHLVDARAAGFGKRVVVEGGRITVAVDACLMDNAVDLCQSGTYSLTHMRKHKMSRPSVVIPGRTARPAISRTSRASRFVRRIRRMTSALLTKPRRAGEKATSSNLKQNVIIQYTFNGRAVPGDFGKGNTVRTIRVVGTGNVRRHFKFRHHLRHAA